jgi:hypothetical protein
MALSNISSNSSWRERRGTHLHAVVAARESVARNVQLCWGRTTLASGGPVALPGGGSMIWKMLTPRPGPKCGRLA